MTHLDPQRPLNASAREALQAQFALRLCARLNDDPRPLPHGVAERLQFARQQACRKAPQPMVLVPARRPRSFWANPMAGLRSDGSLVWKLASALPVALLVVGFMGINWWDQEEQTEAAAEVDVALLSDDIPPTAYADQGFAEFLQTSGDIAPATQTP